MKIAAQFASKDKKLVFIKNGAAVRTDNFIKIDFDAEAQTFADAREKIHALRGESQNGGTLPGDGGAESRNGEIKIIALCVPCENVALGDSSYNEAFLAALRNFIKGAEAQGFYAVLAPIFNGSGATAFSQNGGFLSHEDAERVIAAACHTARRVKDCSSVAGFAVPEPLSDGDARLFMKEMSAKHAQYVYFSRAGRTGTLAFGFA